MTGSRAERRTGWALPPQPPENWVGNRWAIALLGALAIGVLLPALTLREPHTSWTVPLALLHAAAGCGALAAGYVLLVQSTVTADPRLRWVAAGYAAVWPLVLLRSAELGGPAPVIAEEAQRAAALTLLWLLAVPLLALTASAAPHPERLLLPLNALAAAALACLVLPALPTFVAPTGERSNALRAACLALALLAAGAAVQWHRARARSSAGTAAWVTVGLALTAAAGLLLALAGRNGEALWWTGQVLLLVGMGVPALGLSLISGAGYRRQSRRWRQLVTEVADLRAASPLLPGLSVSPEDDEGLPEERDVRALINAGHVKVALQPVVQLDGGAILGYEALSRFGGRVPTDRWFRGANRCGLGGELERLTLQAALTLLPTLPEDVFLAVNVSPAALEDAPVRALLLGVDLHRVVVEVTEHEAVGDYTVTRRILAELRERGARIAVDDTGAGFASLRHVLMLQPDIVKLDTSLSRAVHHDERQQKLVKALLTFAHEVGSVVLAEGIETEEQLDALRELGMPLGQGWHLGVPTIVN